MIVQGSLTSEVKLTPIQKNLNNLNQMNFLCTVTSKIKGKLTANTITPFQSGSNESNFSQKRKYKVRCLFS